ncbi:MAG: BamA/TamA family outer membrane protein [Planctomycetota bacterium]|nr:BamA/TamA family outer membrane protein [Planctomycetota bacterium]
MAFAKEIEESVKSGKLSKEEGEKKLIAARRENFRVASGSGLRVTVPALGPAPLAFDFAHPINHADSNDRQIFSFFMGFTR